MVYEIDKAYMIGFMEQLMGAPSPSGYCDKAYEIIKRFAAGMGLELYHDVKGTGYIRINGKSSEKTIAVSAHVDTIGLMVKSIETDGKIKVASIGGVNYSSIEGESVTVHTRDNRCYNGIICCKSHSVHVFQDARTLERSAGNMFLLLNERVFSKKDVENLGVLAGDHISIEPRFEYTEKGFVKSRFIDDKGCVAAAFAVLKTITENKIKPMYDLLFIFSQFEETGHGGAYVPEGITEYLSVDIGLIGPELNGNEYEVSINAGDGKGPYDRNFTTRLVDLAKLHNIGFQVDVFQNYATDGSMARIAGNNLITAAVGPGTYNSHGMERTHIDGLENTAKLILAYVLEG